tara:strand:+ start:1173 stop:1280 length:108 start_codon:yes stop_codon:yes gene_type:complete
VEEGVLDPLEELLTVHIMDMLVLVMEHMVLVRWQD